MKVCARAAAVTGFTLFLAVLGALPSAALEPCPMGGVMVRVADDSERPVSTRKMNKAFGSKLAKPRKAVMDEFRQLRKYRVVDIAGEDVARIASAVAVGSLIKDGGEWVVETSDCEGVTVDVSAIE